MSNIRRRTNEEVIRDIKSGGDKQKLMLELWQQVEGLVVQAVNRYNGIAEREDMMQEAYLAFDNAVRLYDPEAGILFSSYLVPALRRWLHTVYIRKGQTIRISPKLYRNIALIERYRTAYQAEHGKAPSFYELSEGTGLSLSDIKAADKASELKNVSSLDSTINSSKEDIGTIGDVIADSRDDIGALEQDIYEGQKKAAVWKAVDELPASQSVVLHRYFEDGQTYEAIGKDLGIHPQTASDRAEKAFKKLRGKAYRKRLLPFYDGLHSRAMKGGGAEIFKETWTSSTEREAMKKYEMEQEMQRDLESLMRRISPELEGTELWGKVLANLAAG